MNPAGIPVDYDRRPTLLNTAAAGGAFLGHELRVDLGSQGAGLLGICEGCQPDECCQSGADESVY